MNELFVQIILGISIASVPLIFAATGELLVERSGVLVPASGTTRVGKQRVSGKNKVTGNNHLLAQERARRVSSLKNGQEWSPCSRTGKNSLLAQ